MNDLIARLEAATGPSRELDCLIGATGIVWKDLTEEELQTVLASITREHGTDEDGNQYSTLSDACPHYTASVDAALGLKPDGMTVELAEAYGPGRTDWSATVTPRKEYGSPVFYRAHASSPALALCIAALRARQGGGG
jgi:hypothetical protein